MKRLPGKLFQRPLLLCALTLPLAACVSTGVRDLEITPPKTLDTRIGSQLTLVFPTGDVVIEPSKDDQLHAEVRFFCNAESEACAEKAAEAGIVHAQQGDQSSLFFEPSSAYTSRHADMRFRIRVPTVSQLDIELDAGALRVDSATGCLTIAVGAGDLSITAPLSDVKSVFLDANLGDASLKTPGGAIFDERKLLVGSEVLWENGLGSCHLKAKVQAGALEATLTDAN